MEHIILQAEKTGVVVFDLADMQARLADLTDPRAKRGKIYPLGMLLTGILLAKLAGEDKPAGISHWLRLRRERLVSLFQLKHKRMPCLNVIRGVLQEIVSLAELEKLFGSYLHEQYGGQQSELITIDGKTMRGTIPKGNTQGVHLMAAYLPAEGIVLKQVEVESKTNEITAAPQLLASLDLKNRVVCGDAMQTQRQLSVDILAKGGDYLWFLKENQATTLGDVAQYFKPPQVSSGWPLPALPQTEASQTNSGHGRLERRTLRLLTDEEAYLDWPGVRQLFRLERKRCETRTGIETTEIVYGITSCSPERASAEQLLNWTRQYWGIENGLHYRRDVTLHEDATRISQPALAKSMATINNFIVGLAQKLGFSNLAAARRAFDAAISAQLPIPAN